MDQHHHKNKRKRKHKQQHVELPQTLDPKQDPNYQSVQSFSNYHPSLQQPNQPTYGQTPSIVYDHQDSAQLRQT